MTELGNSPVPEVSAREYERARYAIPHHILRSEAIYGEGFQSPGGLTGFREMLLPAMSLRPGMRALDIGSGLGGAAFHLAAEYRVEVVGVDLAEVMISLATERAAERDPARRVRFIHGDVFSDELAERSFDIVYSRDSLLYEADKPAVFARCARLLRPGGSLVISDFCRGVSTPDFEEYVSVSGYSLPTNEEYAALLAEAGLESVSAKDLSGATGDNLRRDLAAYQERARREGSLDSADVQHITERWQRKVAFIEQGALTQGVFTATAPTAK
jgi:phosphoethanolamine N-methyltransferase